MRRPGPHARARAAAALLLLAAGAAEAQTDERGQSGLAVAVEGDVVNVGGTDVRLDGIDAPDPGQTCRDRAGTPYDCAAASRRALDRLVGGRRVDCRIVEQDRHGNQVGACTLGGVDIAAVMVESGWAMAYHPLSPRYAGEEARAQSRRRGLWSGRVEAPWIWRSRQGTDGP